VSKSPVDLASSDLRKAWTAVTTVDNCPLACYKNINPDTWRWKVRYFRGPLGLFFMATSPVVGADLSAWGAHRRAIGR